MTYQSLPEEGFIRLEQIIGNKKKNIPPLVPVSRATIYKWISEGRLPAPDKRFGERISVWNVRDIRPLMDAQPQRAFIPFVFSPEQIDQLLLAITKRLRRTKRQFLKDMSTYIALVLIARCGMRLSEPLRVKTVHYRKKEGTLYIEKTKFRKDRLIPVPKIALIELENFLSLRKALMADNQTPYLLVGERDNPISKNKLYPIFHLAVKDIGVAQPRQIIGDVTFGPPRVHSLRHYAINTLKRIKERGQPVQKALPVLAAYMGHCKYQYTGAYLKVLSADHRQGLIEFAKSQWDYV